MVAARNSGDCRICFIKGTKLIYFIFIFSATLEGKIRANALISLVDCILQGDLENDHHQLMLLK